jgi:hypothetical protein
VDACRAARPPLVDGNGGGVRCLFPLKANAMSKVTP